jgi:hypothetical protein
MDSELNLTLFVRQSIAKCVNCLENAGRLLRLKLDLYVHAMYVYHRIAKLLFDMLDLPVSINRWSLAFDERCSGRSDNKLVNGFIVTPTWQLGGQMVVKMVMAKKNRSRPTVNQTVDKFVSLLSFGPHSVGMVPREKRHLMSKWEHMERMRGFQNLF